MRVSDCCGAAPVSNGDCDTEDVGLCPECHDFCEYIEEGDNEDFLDEPDAFSSDNEYFVKTETEAIIKKGY